MCVHAMYMINALNNCYVNNKENVLIYFVKYLEHTSKHSLKMKLN